MSDSLNMGSPSAVLAIVGMSGTGKSVAAQHIGSKNGWSVVYFGGIVVEEVKRRGLQLTPDNERCVREDLRRRHGMAAIATLAAPKIKELLAKGDRVVLDGLYSAAELSQLHDDCGVRVRLLAVHADLRLRYSRLADRVHRPLSQAQVDERDRTELAALDKAPPVVLADYHVLNNTTEDDFKRAIDEALGLFVDAPI